MTVKATSAFARLLLQLSLGLTLLVAGIRIIGGAGDETTIAIRSIFQGDAAKILVTIFAGIEFLLGVFLLLSMFLGKIFPRLTSIFMLIIMVVWVLVIVLLDFLAGHFLSPNFLSWLGQVASHVAMLGAILLLS